MATPVLMLMDYQVGIARNTQRSGPEVAQRGVLQAASATLARFRAAKRPVIHIRVAFDDDYSNVTSSSPAFNQMRQQGRMKKDSREAAFCDEVSPIQSELVITKGCIGPFSGTMLLAKLISLRPSHVLMGGVATNFVVESAARQASDYGFQVTVLEDLCASFSREQHDFAVEHMLPNFGNVMSSEQFFSDHSDLF